MHLERCYHGIGVLIVRVVKAIMFVLSWCCDLCKRCWQIRCSGHGSFEKGWTSIYNEIL